VNLSKFWVHTGFCQGYHFASFQGDGTYANRKNVKCLKQRSSWKVPEAFVLNAVSSTVHTKL
jgi:hypothetical protein